MKDSIFRQIRRKSLAWVLACAGFAVFNMQSHAAPAQLQGYVMQVQMTPAVCALDSNKKQRKCTEGYSLTVSGLLPEINRSSCMTDTSALLSPLQSKVVARVMPEDNARIQLWRNIGGCVPMNASQYFRMIINLADKLKIPADLTGSESKKVQYEALKAQFLRLNPTMSSNSIRFTCQSSRNTILLTKLQICYQSNGQYKACPAQLLSNCPSSFSIKGAY